MRGAAGSPAIDRWKRRHEYAAPVRARPFGYLPRAPEGHSALGAVAVAAGVRDVCFDLAPGETLGIVGESGSGKSTLARALIGTVPASGGQGFWQGEDLLSMSPGERHRHRRDIQMIFQDPLAALDPADDGGRDHRRAARHS